MPTMQLGRNMATYNIVYRKPIRGKSRFYYRFVHKTDEG